MEPDTTRFSSVPARRYRQNLRGSPCMVSESCPASDRSVIGGDESDKDEPVAADAAPCAIFHSSSSGKIYASAPAYSQPTVDCSRSNEPGRPGASPSRRTARCPSRNRGKTCLRSTPHQAPEKTLPIPAECEMVIRCRLTVYRMCPPTTIFSEGYPEYNGMQIIVSPRRC